MSPGASARRRWSNGPFDRAFWLGEIDARLPAVFRIGLAAVLLLDLLGEFPIVTALYGAHGVWPPLHVRGFLHHLSDRALLFAWAGGCLALGSLMLGLFSRASATASWIFLVAVHLRNEAICSGGDYLAQICLFFLIWLDAGAAYSLDARWRGRGRRFVAAAPWRAMQVHVALLYVFTAAFKMAGAWATGDGIFLALQQLGFVRPFGAWLFSHPSLCLLTNYCIVALEASVGILALSPIYSPGARLGAGLGNVMVQLGIFSTMRVGVFTMVMLWMTVLFFPEPTPAPEVPATPRRWALLTLCIGAVALASGTGIVRLPLRLQAARAYLGLRQPLDLFGAGIPIAQWRARGRLDDGSEVDVLAAAPGFRSEVGWVYSPFYKLTFGDSLDHAAIARWLCGAYRDETGKPLRSIVLSTHARPPVRPGVDAPFTDTILYDDTCPIVRDNDR